MQMMQGGRTRERASEREGERQKEGEEDEREDDVSARFLLVIQKRCCAVSHRRARVGKVVTKGADVVKRKRVNKTH
jgi:hypothetical protein